MSNSSNLSISEKNTRSTSLIDNLRRFRFQRKQFAKMNTSDEDSSPSEFQTRRKPVNRIEDSDSDAASSIKQSPDTVSPKEKEERLKYLKSMFPYIESLRIAKILKEANWLAEPAEEKLKEIQRPSDEDIEKRTVLLIDDDFRSMHSSSPEQNKRKKRPMKSSSQNKKKRRKLHHDEDVDDDSDAATYNSKVFDSDDDSEAEISNHMTADKKGVLEFMQHALPSELLSMHYCSKKKADAIVEARPFNDWRDLVEKFQNNRFLDTELLNSAQVVLAMRSVVESLMKKCLKLSTNMAKAIAAGATNVRSQPKSLSPALTLAPYQMVGLNWLAVMHDQNVNGILADEMGLGKTVQVIAFLTYLKEAGLIDGTGGPHLIVVPSSTMENWKNELKRWSPGLNLVQYYGSQDERKEMRMNWRAGDLEDVDIILTTYNLVSSTPEERRLFRVMPIQYVIFDEAHMLKNMATIRYDNLVRINAKHRILLTGTPMQNNLLELISLLIFVMPTMFSGKQTELKSLFAKNNKLAGDKNNGDQSKFEQEQVTNAKQIMKPFILRRLKSEVLRDLPIKTEQLYRCPLNKEQRKMYTNLVATFNAEADQNAELNGVGMMMQLRKLANHPLLVRRYYDETKLKEMAKKLARDPTYKQKNPDYVFEDLLWMSDYQINQLSRNHKCISGEGLPQELIPKAGKLEKLDKLLPKLKSGGHRVLLFSQFTMVLDILEEYLAIRGHKFLRLDGQTAVPERQPLIDEFSSDPSIFIFLLSTRAGGLGINLTSADTVIIHDLDFNPYNDKQAEDRCHRVGQTRPVSIIKLLGKDTIEEGMYDIAQEKLNLEQQITNNEADATDKKSVIKLLKMALGLDPHNKSLSLSPTKSPNGTSD